MTASPVWFGPTVRPRFGWFHSPDDGRARAGVVVCPPFGREYLVAHYALRLVAQKLESLGMCVLRFDYDGVGDSAGDDEDHDRVNAWLRSISDAVALVRSTGVEQVSMVGMRLGALLAACMAAQDGEIDQMVLWDPCVSGRAFLTEQRALNAIAFGITSPSDGSLRGPGMAYSRETVSQLNGIEFTSLKAPLARRALVMTRPDKPAGRRLDPSLAESVEWEEAVGQAELMDFGPPRQRLPYQSIERIASWVSEGAHSQPIALKLPSTAGTATVDHDSEGHAIRERPIWSEPTRLFGIVTEASGDVQPSGPMVVFLNVANEHHVGPARLWVDLARRWAVSGVSSVRVDLSGLGDSPRRRAGQREFEALLPEAFEDVREVAKTVSPRDPSNVVLIGLSSSGYQVIESGLELLPRGIVALNPTLWFVPPEREAGLPIDHQRKVLFPHNAVVPSVRGSSLHRKLRHRFPTLGLRTMPTRHAHIYRLSRIIANLGWRIRMLRKPSRRASAWLGTLVDAGVDVLLVCGERESRPIRVGTSVRKLTRLAQDGSIRFEVFPELEHGLLIDTQYKMIAELATEFVVGRVAMHSRSTKNSSPSRRPSHAPVASSERTVTPKLHDPLGATPSSG